MGGDATFSGTTYQAKVIALVYTHVLAQIRLGWFSPADDTPIAVSGEVQGPGDDAKVEFGALLADAEVQAKHGLTGGDELSKVVERLCTQTPAGQTIPVVLAVDRPRTTRWIYAQLPSDISRLRSGRTDGLKADTERLLKELTDAGAPTAVLQALYVVPIDVDAVHEPDEVRVPFASDCNSRRARPGCGRVVGARRRRGNDLRPATTARPKATHRIARGRPHQGEAPCQRRPVVSAP